MMSSKAHVVQSLANIEKVYSALIMTTNVDNTTPQIITWKNYRPGILSNISYPREYQILVDTSQYSYLMKDNSFFQFYFSYDEKEVLTKCRLAYYPAPAFTKESAENIEEYRSSATDWLCDILDEVTIDMLENDTKLTQNSHIRFDYDSEVKSHSKCHLQFGGINDFRISSRKLVLPFAFFTKIISDFHPNWLSEAKSPKVKDASLRHGVNNAYSFTENDLFIITV
ncbi:DUF2290 domain-containing protein [Vibrio alginolyticus]|uniref:DUF2290 domain-containing protein n=2 Tax=Vibrio harveyi group TaxID=717610 RepID=UPI003754FF23|nr:DUF2290 domain-containing protein [Vibrio alginolyticus]